MTTKKTKVKAAPKTEVETDPKAGVKTSGKKLPKKGPRAPIAKLAAFRTRGLGEEGSRLLRQAVSRIYKEGAHNERRQYADEIAAAYRRAPHWAKGTIKAKLRRAGRAA